VRFDDSLNTVLAAAASSGAGAQATWRQLVDLTGRGRVTAVEPAIARLRMLRQVVPAEVRAASARALAFAHPGAALVGFFAEDRLAIAAPVLRTATLEATEWIAMLARLTPETRSILRHRRDLPAEVGRALESFGATDFTLPNHAPANDQQPAPVVAPAPAPAPPLVEPPADTPRSATPFVALGEIARGLPMVAEALRQTQDAPAGAEEPERFEIAELVARIDAFNRQRDGDPAPAAAPAPVPDHATTFRFATDASGIVTWVDGVAPGALVGLSLAHAVRQGVVNVDAVMSGALRRRSRFDDARLDIDGLSDAAGSWRVSGAPAFDDRTGRFTGLRATARRPRVDEHAEPAGARQSASDSLRQLVHELRTPTNAIAGFAELIESQLLGPVAPVYRERAITIRDQASSLIAAIDDLDTAARIDGRALDLRPLAVTLLPLLGRIVGDLAPLIALRGAELVIDAPMPVNVLADDRALERLLSRLLATLVAATTRGERIAVAVAALPSGEVAIAFDRPLAFGRQDDAALLSIDADPSDEVAPLLGTGFALRLARNLAGELGGTLAIDPDRLTLRLPLARDDALGQATR
jgi:signal transduction histidine kinase